MPEHDAHEKTTSGAEPMNPTVAFEAKDVSVTGVERAGLGLGIVIVIVLAVAAGAYHLLTRVPPVGTPEVAASMSTDQNRLPPSPRMQGIPGDTVPPPEQQRDFQAAAAAELDSYGWVDAQHGIAHIPIEDAMAMLVKNGLPRAAPPQIAAHGKTAAPAAKGKKVR